MINIRLFAYGSFLLIVIFGVLVPSVKANISVSKTVVVAPCSTATCYPYTIYFTMLAGMSITGTIKSDQPFVVFVLNYQTYQNMYGNVGPSPSSDCCLNSKLVTSSYSLYWVAPATVDSTHPYYLVIINMGSASATVAIHVWTTE